MQEEDFTKTFLTLRTKLLETHKSEFLSVEDLRTESNLQDYIDIDGTSVRGEW